jgi:hypothetical protein
VAGAGEFEGWAVLLTLPCFQVYLEVALELGQSLSRNCYNLLVHRELITSWCLYLVGNKKFLTMAGIKKI